MENFFIYFRYVVPVSLYSLHPYGCAKCFIKNIVHYINNNKNNKVMQNLNDLFLSEKEKVDVELQSLTEEAQSNNLDMKKLLKPLNDYSENSLSTVGQFTNHEFVKGDYQHYKLIDNNGCKISLSNLLGRAVKNQPFKFKANKNGLAMLDNTESINEDLVNFSKGKTTLEMVAFLKNKYFKSTPVKQFSYFAPQDKDSKNTLQFFNSLNEVDILGYIPLKQFFKIELITEKEYKELTKTEKAAKK